MGASGIFAKINKKSTSLPEGTFVGLLRLSESSYKELSLEKKSGGRYAVTPLCNIVFIPYCSYELVERKSIPRIIQGILNKEMKRKEGASSKTMGRMSSRGGGPLHKKSRSGIVLHG